MVSGRTRREFMAAAAALGATLALTSISARASTRSWIERRDLYPQGVASGDPTPDSVILWTRRPPLSGETVPQLFLEVAEDPHFERVVTSASLEPSSANDWTCRVLAAGLKPSTIYWYRFSDAHGFGSRLGRTRTAPAPDDERPVNFTFVSCQNVTQGACNAFRRMIWEDEQKSEDTQLEFVMHLGDFFYEVVWYPEDRPQGMYARRLRDIVRYPHGEKHADFHVPTDLEDYRTIFRAYLLDPDLADARARWPFVCMWDNHEFSWQGWQTLEDYGDGVFPAQTRKVAAAQAWFEYQPARIKKVGSQALDEFDAPAVSNAPIESFDDYGMGQEPNNLAAVHALTLYRAMQWGRNVDLILTDNRTFRSQLAISDPRAKALNARGFVGVVPEEVVDILEAGRAYNNGSPPDTITVGDVEVANWRKNEPPQSMLGREQKRWFLDTLKASTAPWKLWGNTVGMLDARIDFHNLPASQDLHWPGAGYASLTSDDWSGYRTERAEIFDFVRAEKITGFASLAGDRHAFFAGVLSKSLPPLAFNPIGVEFVTGSISAPTVFEAFEYKYPKDSPVRSFFVYQPDASAAALPSMNFSGLHGVVASAHLQKTGDLRGALALSNPEVAPHLKLMDWGGHGYVAVRASADALEGEIVCLPRPLERSTTADGGPLAYRARYRIARWQAGDIPHVEPIAIEGNPPLAT